MVRIVLAQMRRRLIFRVVQLIMSVCLKIELVWQLSRQRMLWEHLVMPLRAVLIVPLLILMPRQAHFHFNLYQTLKQMPHPMWLKSL